MNLLCLFSILCIKAAQNLLPEQHWLYGSGVASNNENLEQDFRESFLKIQNSAQGEWALCKTHLVSFTPGQKNLSEGDQHLQAVTAVHPVTL